MVEANEACAAGRRRGLPRIGRVDPADFPSGRDREVNAMSTRASAVGDAGAADDGHFRGLVEGSIHAVVVHRDNRVLYANPAAARILGFDTAAEVVALDSIDAIVAPPERARLERYRRARAEGAEAPQGYQARFLRKDGSTIWVDIVAGLLEWDSRPAIRIEFIDISEQKRTEELLRQLASGVSSATGSEFFRALVAYLVETLEADYAFVGQLKEGDPKTVQTVAFCAQGELASNIEYSLAGSPCETVVGRSVCVYTSGVCRDFPEDRSLVEKGIECYIGTPLFDSQGRPLGLISIMYIEPQIDTELRANLIQIFADRAAAELERLRVEDARREAEAKLRALNEELERRVAERTAELEASNRELESFTYSVSHDLRAPLRHVTGYVRLLERSAMDRLEEGDRRHLDTIADSSARMGALIDHLLAFSRIGRAELRSTTVALDALVDAVIEELEPETQGRSIEWHREPLPSVGGDPKMLQLVLNNLIANAIKFTRGREPARITIAADTRDRHEVVIFVRDNGVGFDMKYEGKLFGVFERLHGADEFEGTGIGLANVRRIVHRHGGRTWAHSRTEGGATFFFSLPCRGDPVDAGDWSNTARRG